MNSENVHRRSFLRTTGGFATAGLVGLGGDGLRAAVRAKPSRQVKISEAGREVMNFVSTFASAACYHGGGIAGDINPGESPFVDLLVRYEDPGQFSWSLAGDEDGGGIPFEAVHARGNTLSFWHGDEFFTIEMLSGEAFGARLAEIRSGGTSIYSHDALTCPMGRPAAIDDPLGACSHSVGGVLCIDLSDDRWSLGAGARFEAVLDGLADLGKYNLSPSAELATFRSAVLSQVSPDDELADVVRSLVVQRLSSLTRLLTPATIAAVMNSVIVDSSLSRLGRPRSAVIGARFAALRASVSDRFTDGAIWLSILLQSEIAEGMAEGEIWSGDRHAYLQAREDLRLAKEIASASVVAPAVASPAPTTFARWAGVHLGAVPGAREDTDKDGVPDLVEYALGMDPNVASQVGLPISAVETIGDTEYLTLSYRKDITKTDIVYEVQTATGLQARSWATGGVVDTIVGSDGPAIELRVARVPFDSPQRFLRLLIRMVE